ncbi:MAG: 5'-methylthioadenosine/S-adenosylhomocysteine nucleosidase [Treponema sp.]|jgi:adenosylhomocysteine nucleosidase|nr:5'-methylthioadenosine/S-adenosylhomocysteine nucleosidase [Treponema sp.]
MIGIIGAMEDEVTILRQAIKNVKNETVGGFEFNSGSLEGKDVVLLRCGISKVNAAVGCALLIERYHPSLVINTGSAGGLDPSLNIGDAIISDGLVQHDVDVTGFGYLPGQIPHMPQIFTVPGDLIDLAERSVDELKKEGRLPVDFNHVRGLIGSGDVFMHEEDKIRALLERFPSLRAVEMEGAAIAQACYLFQIPSLIIRAVSDIAGKESPVTSVEFLPMASRHSGEIVQRIVKNIV